MNWTATLPHLTFRNLSSYHVPHAVTTRSWGSLNPFVGYKGLSRLEQGLSLNSASCLASRVVYAELVQGAQVHPCVASDGGSIRLQMDGLLADDPHLLLAIYIADCIPLFIYDPSSATVAILHAGRRGLIAGLIENALRTLHSRQGSRPQDLLVGIGPGLRSCCYEIQSDIFPELTSAGWMDYVEEREGKNYLDLIEACHLKLTSNGFHESHIEDMEVCTACRSDLFFSSRRRTDADERGASFAGIISAPDRRPSVT